MVVDDGSWVEGVVENRIQNMYNIRIGSATRLVEYDNIQPSVHEPLPDEDFYRAGTHDSHDMHIDQHFAVGESVVVFDNGSSVEGVVENRIKNIYNIRIGSATKIFEYDTIQSLVHEPVPDEDLYRAEADVHNHFTGEVTDGPKVEKRSIERLKQPEIVENRKWSVNGKPVKFSASDRLQRLNKTICNKLEQYTEKIMEIMDVDKNDIGIGEKVDMILFSTFKRCSEAGTSHLDADGFNRAWEELNLDGDEGEIIAAYNEVDYECSGSINFVQFQEALIKHRHAELSIGLLSSEFEGYLDGMTDYIHQIKQVQFGHQFKEKSDNLETKLKDKDHELRYSLQKIKTLEAEDTEKMNKLEETGRKLRFSLSRIGTLEGEARRLSQMNLMQDVSETSEIKDETSEGNFQSKRLAGAPTTSREGEISSEHLDQRRSPRGPRKVEMHPQKPSANDSDMVYE